jgi:hypothetical protein
MLFFDFILAIWKLALIEKLPKGAANFLNIEVPSNVCFFLQTTIFT